MPDPKVNIIKKLDATGINLENPSSKPVVKIIKKLDADQTHMITPVYEQENYTGFDETSVDDLENVNDDEKSWLKNSRQMIGQTLNDGKTFTEQDWDQAKKIMNKESLLTDDQNKQLVESLRPLIGKPDKSGHVFTETDLQNVQNLANREIPGIGKITNDYYFDADGLPKVLNYGEKLPKGAKVESVWGNFASSSDDNPITTGAKAFFNTALDALKVPVDIYEIGHGLATAEGSEFANTYKSGLSRYHFDKRAESEERIINTENIHGFNDLLKSDTWNVNAQNSASFVGSILGYVAQYALGGAVLGVGKAANAAIRAEELATTAVEAGSGMAGRASILATQASRAKWIKSAAASIAISTDEALNIVDQSGLTGRDKYTVAALTAIGTGLLEIGIGGVEMRAMGASEKRAAAGVISTEMVENLVKNGKKITAENLEQAFQASLKKGRQLIPKFIKNAGAEAGEEALQTYYQEAVQQIYDKTVDNKFGADVTGAKVFAEALEGAIGGALMGGFGGVNNPANQDEQAKDIYRAIKLGKERDLYNQFHNMKAAGQITENDYNLAIAKVKEFKNYIDEVKNIPANDDAKARAAQIVYEDKNIEASITNIESSEGKESIISQAKIKALQKQRADYLNELTDIYSGTWKKAGKTEGATGEEKKANAEEKPAPDAQENVSVPVMITKDMERQLADLGYSKEEVKKLKPEQANSIIEKQTTYKKPAEEKVEPGIKAVDELYGRTVSLNIGNDRKKGRVFKDAENTVVFEDESGKEYDLGKEQSFGEEQIKNTAPVIEQDNLEKINISDDGKTISIDGKDYINDVVDPESSVLKTKNGYSITLKTKDGKSRTFRGQGAENIAYVFTKRKFSEQVTESEEHMANLDAIINEVEEDAKLNPEKYEPTQTEAGSDEKTAKKSTGEVKQYVTKQKDGGDESVPETEQKEEKLTEAKADSENAREYVKHLEGTKYKKSRGFLDKRPGTKIKNNVYDFVDEAGHRLKLASWKYLKNVSKDISGTKVQSRLITPEDSDLGSYEDNIRTLANGKKVFTFRLFNRKDNTTKDQDYPFIIRLTDMKTGKDIANLRVTDYGEQPGKPKKEKPVAPKVSPDDTETKPSVKNDVKTDTNEESTTQQKESATGNTQKTRSETAGQTKAKTVRTDTKRSNRKIKHPEKLQALSHEVFTPHDIALQYFIRGGLISSKAVQSLFKGSNAERMARISYTAKNAPTVKDIAHALWEEHADALRFDTSDFENAVEEVVIAHNSATSMSKELNKSYAEKSVLFSIPEVELNQVYEAAEEQGLSEAMDEVIEGLEELSDEEIIEMVDDDQVQDEFIEKLDLPDDIIRNDGMEDQFQKTDEEHELFIKEYNNPIVTKENFHVNTFTDFKKIKLKELPQRSPDFTSRSGSKYWYEGDDIFRQSDHWGRTIASCNWLIDGKAYQESTQGVSKLSNFYRRRTEKFEVGKSYTTIKTVLRRNGGGAMDIDKQKGKFVKETSDYYIFDNHKVAKQTLAAAISEEELQLQKKSIDANQKNIDKVVKVIQKAFPKIKVEYNADLKAAGVLRAKGKIKTIEINPYYAGLDTPIHEAGHVLIDAMGGLENSIIRSAVKQLKDTDLWNETKERYPELSDDMLAKEVLAEAIGREGAKIFDTEAKKKKFQHLLDYIFDWFKTKLGINKNVAKSLAKQIIGGVGTKNLTGESKIDQKQKIKEEDQENPEGKRQRLEQRAINKVQKALKKRFKTWEDYASSKGHNDVTFTINKENLDDEIATEKDSKKKAELQERRDAMDDIEKAYKEEFRAFNTDMKAIQAMIESNGDLSKLPLKKLTDWYWILNKYRYDMDGNTFFNKVKDRIGMQMRNLRADEIKEAFPDFDIEKYEKEDLAPSEVYMKGITDMTEKHPELQFLETAYKDAVTKNNLEFEQILKESTELAKAVITEYNQKNGITGRAARLINPLHENSKYFSYMEDPQSPGKFKKADDPSLSPAQAALLNHILKTKNKSEFKKSMTVDGISLDDNAVIKVDAKATEQFKSRGWFAAWSKMLGNTYNTRQQDVEFQNPETKVNSKMQFGDVETLLEDYSKKGQTQKLNAIYLLRKYSKLAEKEISKGSNELKGNAKFYIGKDGLVTSAYASENDQYSKDFFNAYLKYMQDAVFAKNMNEILPYLHGAENLEKVMGKTNAVNFLDIWKKGHITKEEIVGKFGKDADKILKFFRIWTHARIMAFNLPAGLFNLIVGKYNQYRSQDGSKFLTGEKLMAKSLAKAGFKPSQAKAFNIAKMYQAAGPEQNLNPDKHVGNIFSALMYGASSFTETWIQYSSFLSQMTDEEYKWHDDQGNITGSSPEIIAERKAHMLKQARKFKDKIQSIQGKYSQEYRRNFTLFELGRTIGQFKIWFPETYMERFGSTYINSNNERVTGSARSLLQAGFRDAYKHIYKKEFYSSQEEKYVMARKNIKDLVAVAGAMSLLLGASDDDKDKQYANNLDRLIGDMTSVYNLKTYAYMVTNPMPAMKTTSDLIKAVQQSMELNEKAINSAFKLAPYHKIGEAASDLLDE